MEEKETKKLKDLKVIDIIQMPAFEGHVKFLMKDLHRTRTKLYMEKGVEFKRGPIERLQEKGVYNPKALADLYAKVLGKYIDTSEYPSVLRTFIKGLCDEAFHRTVEQIKAKENETANKGNNKG